MLFIGQLIFKSQAKNEDAEAEKIDHKKKAIYREQDRANERIDAEIRENE